MTKADMIRIMNDMVRMFQENYPKRAKELEEIKAKLEQLWVE